MMYYSLLASVGNGGDMFIGGGIENQDEAWQHVLTVEEGILHQPDNDPHR